MSFGRLQAALAAATNEVTVAAANINFDFTLVKYEAPKEYQPLGGILSLKRKHDAEDGNAHMTARRLGALFEGACPSTPNLVSAYGKRVSEIAEEATNNESKDYKNSIFDAYSGVDGTSIWAAATSSKAALPVHLLACMLARAFPAPEAISIWVELVREQRRSISERLERGDALPFSLAAAAGQQEISRSHLAEWDASVRAWLCTADRIKRQQQTQLRLILDNCELHVDGSIVTSSVLGAWKSAMTTMENLLAGMPQAIHDGAVIIGLSAWHLYPDMAHFGSHTVEIVMNDSLVGAGGVLSLGLAASQRAMSGVSWSLSLSNLRFYGTPVRSQGMVVADPSRITFPQFRLTVLGAILGAWRVATQDTEIYFKILHQMCTLFQHSSQARASDSWIRVLSETTHAFLDRVDMSERLVGLGRRRSGDFLLQIKDPEPPLFHLLNTTTLLDCLSDTESKIHLLRRVAARHVNDTAETPVIRYYHDCGIDTEARCQELEEVCCETMMQDVSISSGKHCTARSQRNERKRKRGVNGVDSLGHRQHKPAAAERNRPSIQIPRFASVIANKLPLTGLVPESETRHDYHRWYTLGQQGLRDGEGCHRYCVAHDYIEWPNSFRLKGKDFDFCCGDLSQNVALFTEKNKTRPSMSPCYDDILWCFGCGDFDVNRLRTLIERSKLYHMFDLLEAISMVYLKIPEATVNVTVLKQSILDTKFARNIRNGGVGSGDVDRPNRSHILGWFSRSDALSMVIYFESGFDVDRSDLKNVIAVSAGDRIYVPRQLLNDPYEISPVYSLQTILGNVGKPGVVMLSFPKGKPMVRQLDVGGWKLASDAEFDGTTSDQFASTSLHLSFTDYHAPFYHRDAQGQQDAQLTMLESVISVYDSGQWIADVDVLKAFDRGILFRQTCDWTCEHPRGTPPPAGMISVKDWDNVLDRPDGILVVHAKGNWVARLAIAAFVAQSSKHDTDKVSICREDVCWVCLRNKHPFNVIVY